MFIALVKENEESNSYHSSMKDFENIFKMSFLTNSYVCVGVFSRPYDFSSPGLLGSFLISFYILRSVLHTTSIALTKRVHVLNRKVFIAWQSFSVIVTFILNSGVILTLRACLKVIKGNVNQKLSTTEIGNRVGL